MRNDGIPDLIVAHAISFHGIVRRGSLEDGDDGGDCDDCNDSYSAPGGGEDEYLEVGEVDDNPPPPPPGGGGGGGGGGGPDWFCFWLDWYIDDDNGMPIYLGSDLICIEWAT